jgi:acyl-CoA synthetase (NDP forming)
LDGADFVEYLASDDETKIIGMYLEGIGDGGRLVRLIRETSPTKPVILMKGGVTESGARAVASHTGSLAGGEHMWEALYRQTGAIKVTSLEEMVDVLVALLHLGVPQGRRVGVLGTGGGVSVLAADTLTRAGLELPALAEETRKGLREFVPVAGSITENPVDAGIAFADTGLMERALRTLSADPHVDIILVALTIDWFFEYSEGKHIDMLAQYLAGSARDHVNGKPLAVSWRRLRTDSGIERAEAALHSGLVRGGLPVYNGLVRAAFALARAAEYHEFCRAKSASRA